MEPWEDPNNLAFAQAWICAEQRRQKDFFKRHYFQQSQTWNWDFNVCFRSPIQDDFSPNVGIEQYAQYNPDPEDLSAWPGPLWQMLPGGGLFYLDADSYFGNSQKSLWDGLKRLGGWTERPTLVDLCNAFKAQISQAEPNSFPFLSGDRYYKESFLSLVRNRQKELWHFDPVTNPPDRTTIYVGRVQPDFRTVTASGEYIDAVFLIEPFGTAGIRCYKLSCAGCCCCC